MRSIRADSGYSLLEVLIVVALSGVLLGSAVLNTRVMRDVSKDAASGIEEMIKKSRSKALATTKAYTVRPSSTGRLISTYGDSCTSTVQTSDAELSFTLPTGASLLSTSWSVCYSSRGLSQSSVNIQVYDGTRTKTVQVVLGGGVRIT